MQRHELRIHDCTIALACTGFVPFVNISSGMFFSGAIAESKRQLDSLKREREEIEKNKEHADMAEEWFKDMQRLEAAMDT